MARILVTGASGFIGTALLRRLQADGHDVTVLLHRREPTREAFAGTRQVRADVTDAGSLRGQFDRSDLVFHLAGCTIARSPRQFMEVNCRGTVHVARACAQAANPPKLVFVSSLAAAGPARENVPLTERAPASPVSDYGRSKLAAERELQGLADQLAIQIVRPPSVMGDCDPYMLSLFKAAKAGWVFLPGTRLFPMFQNGARQNGARQNGARQNGAAQKSQEGARHPRYSMIHVDDLVEAMVHLAWRDDVRLLASSDSVPPAKFCEMPHQKPHQQTGGEAAAEREAALPAPVGANPGLVHLAQDPPLTFVETAQLVSDLFSRRPVRVVGIPASLCWTLAAANTLVSRLVPYRPLLNLDKMREGMAGPWMADSTRLTDELGFQFPHTLQHRIGQTVEGYRQKGWL